MRSSTFAWSRGHRSACRSSCADIKWAGICHSDIHNVREEWGKAIFPMVPGHEIAGVVVSVGSAVTKFKVGDHAGIGVFVDSCRKCVKCKEGREQYCTAGPGKLLTYAQRFGYDHCPEYTPDLGASADQASAEYCTFGGYSEYIVCDEEYTLAIPKSLDLAAAAPLLCAGITVWSPLMCVVASRRLASPRVASPRLASPRLLPPPVGAF
jgi:uncharacterized zinc-type alcohol dehydrogenase-like protein